MPKFSCADVLDDRDLQGKTAYVIKGDGRFELFCEGALVAVADTIRALTRYAHGERCAAVRIESAIEDP